MKVRVETRLTPKEAKQLGAVAREMKRTQADTIRTLISNEHERIVARGEVDGNAPGTERK